MRYLSALALSISCFYGTAQTKLPVVKANSNQARIYEQHGAVSNWGINPKLKLDVHSTGKLTKPIRVRFVTDVDSIAFKIAPGQHRDLIVLLNGKDSCLTRIEAPGLKDLSRSAIVVHDTIPFLLNAYNTNYVPIVINGTDSLLLNFDTGATEVCIINESLEKKVRSKPELYSRPYGIQVGKQIYQSKLYDIRQAGHGVDGLLGWNLFDGMIVELDYDQHRMIVHSKMPEHILHDKGYQRFELIFIKNKPFIESEISQNGVKSKSLFFFDTGYQRALMLDNDALTAARFPAEKMPVIKKMIMHGTRGNEVPVITADLERLKIGKYDIPNVPAQIMTQGKPMPGINVHYLGSDLLKRFNTVIDLQKNVIYLKPNQLYQVPYADQKSKT
ncbi:retroviral-like aspartic protease family protein [Mucilaginibacter daejeonensis]|uniref:retroviral-like aspartic protease family protein n=1 Tax=Mucilaginibacter daejeonensis TaxID=398049 RepID=UPI001D175092|nr:retroviral-like aspartic protease family protein [Mucilaginibacter daejeonensis]UEG53080.1 retroviral-like aspartic protease family protein [Mucilaginibacter daejeonensis]